MTRGLISSHRWQIAWCAICAMRPPLRSLDHLLPGERASRARQHLFSERSELGAQRRARRQFAPAIHVRTRSLFLTPLRKCQLKKRGRKAQAAAGPQEKTRLLSLAVALESG